MCCRQTELLRTDPSVDVIVLGLRHILVAVILAVNHASSHGDRHRQHLLDELVLAYMAHGMYASLRQCEVDGSREVQWHR